MSTNRVSIGRGGIVLFLVGCGIVLALLGGALWQKSVHDSHADDAASHTKAAALIQSAEAEGTTAGDLLKQYVETGDKTLIPQMQTHTDDGVRQLTAAISAAGTDPNGFLDEGSKLTVAVGQIIALRQAGNVPGAAAGLQKLSEQFNAFTAAQDAFVSSEQQKATSANDSADNADTTARWLVLSATAVGLVLVFGTSVVLVRKFARRRVAATATG
jgi:hypothetical protein